MKFCVGYVPLTDAAAVVAAADLGFARDEGIEIELSSEPSWATLRDRLALDHLDAAHMLAPMALASRLGLSGPQVDLVVPMALSLNGNAITLASALWREMAPATGSLTDTAAAFAAVARRHIAQGRPLTLATVHPFSSHTYQIRLFCELGGLDLRRELRLVVVPPPNSVDALRRGIIDGFCVGAPWNSIAVATGIGRIAALGCDIAPDCPEKVLAMHAAMPSEHLAPLLRAIHRAGIWCADPNHHGELARLLVRRGVGPDEDTISRTLAGDLTLDASGIRRKEPDYIRLGAEVHRPVVAHAHWIAEQMIAAGQGASIADLMPAGAGLYRPDLFDAL